MRRFLAALVVICVAASCGAVQAGQQQVPQTGQVPQQTTEQMVMNCTLTGAIFSVAGGLGLLKPVTVALHTMTTFALLHEAIYGCGVGVISGFVGKALTDMLVPPPGNPFEPQRDAMLPSGAARH